MKKIIKIIIILAILSWVSAWWYFWYEYYKNKNESEKWKDLGKFNENLAVEVTKQDMISSLNFIWNTKIKNEQKLKFNSQAKIVWVYKVAWEKVKKWELIAELDKKELNSQIEISKLALENAQLKLKKIKENNSEIELKKAKIELESSKQDLKNKEKNLKFIIQEQKNKSSQSENDLTKKTLEYNLLQKDIKNSLNELNISPDEKSQQLEESKNKLETLQDEIKTYERDFDLNYDKKVADYNSSIEKEYLEIKNSLNSLNKTFTEFNKLLRFKTNETYSEDYSYFFSVKKSKYKNESYDNFAWAYALYKDIDEDFFDLEWKYDINTINSFMERMLPMYQYLVKASDNVIKWLDNSIEWWDLDSSVMSSFSSQATSLFSESNTKLTYLKTTPLTLKTLKKPEEIKKDMENELKTKKDSLSALKISIEKQQKDYDYFISTLDDKKVQENDKLKDKKTEIDDLKLSIEKSKTNDAYEIDSKKKEIEQAKIAVSEAEKKLKDLLDDSNNQELSLAQNDVKQAEISLKKDTEKLESYELRAPFDWLITKNDYLVWDNLVENDEKSILIQNPDLLEISVFADQVDITKLSKKQKAIITYDAFPWEEFSWEIIDIDSTPQDKDWVTKYEVKIFMTKKDKEIFSWMSAYVNIVTQEKLWVLAVPFSAVKTDEKTWKEYVTVLEKNGKKVKKEIETWYSDWVNTEIVKWVKEWEKVLELDYDSNYYKPEDFETMWWWMY